jgi:hypothetical protein
MQAALLEEEPVLQVVMEVRHVQHQEDRVRLVVGADRLEQAQGQAGRGAGPTEVEHPNAAAGERAARPFLENLGKGAVGRQAVAIGERVAEENDVRVVGSHVRGIHRRADPVGVRLSRVLLQPMIDVPERAHRVGKQAATHGFEEHERRDRGDEEHEGVRQRVLRQASPPRGARAAS